MPKGGKPLVDSLELAKACRSLVRERYVNTTSCIESAFLFERTAFHLGLKASRVVCQATAISALLAQAMKEGKDPKSVQHEPGHWAVAIGSLQFPGDFVGRSEPEKNRFVGHVVCLAHGYLIDPSVDQMHRPEKGLLLPEPVLGPADEGRVVIVQAPSGALVKYELYPNVPVPKPKTDRVLERLAKGLAQKWVR